MKTEMPDGIVYLDYNEKDRQLHFDYDPDKARHANWIRLKALSIEDAISFCEFLEKKYVSNRASGILPELKVVELELQLFLELKTSRRKLAGRA